MLDYPLKFIPILKEKIWGGDKLKNLLHKESDSKNVGESWEISGVKNDISIVANGSFKGQTLNQLLEENGEALLGKKLHRVFGNEFPLLLKFIDAKTELSVQLHPNDRIARERHNSFGKTEMWYILQADEGAKINIGFEKSISKEKYLDYLKAGKISELLHFEKVNKGDAFFINTGKVHAIGGGVLLAEIQQTSDITYRIYDWDRKDEKGQARELHTDLALDALDLERKDDFKLEYSKIANQVSVIQRCEYFTTNFLPVQGVMTRDFSVLDSFVIYMCVSGKAKISVNGNSEEIEMGQTLLVPSENNEVLITSQNAELLEVFVETDL